MTTVGARDPLWLSNQLDNVSAGAHLPAVVRISVPVLYPSAKRDRLRISQRGLQSATMAISNQATQDLPALAKLQNDGIMLQGHFERL